MKGYQTNRDIPKRYRSTLSTEAQVVFRLAYNSALARGEEGLQATQSAMMAVEIGFKLGADGKMVPRDQGDK
jgi:cation transport regulator ChaB